MTSPVKVLAVMIFVEWKSRHGGVNSLEKSAMGAGGASPACRLVQLVNVGHLKAPTYSNRINDDGGFFVAEMSGRAGSTALLIVRREMRDTMKIHISEPCSHR